MSLTSWHEFQWCWPSSCEVRHNVATWNQVEEKLLATTVRESTKPCMYDFLSENDFYSNSDAFLGKDDAPAWDGHHFKTWERRQPHYQLRIQDLLIEFLVASDLTASDYKMCFSSSNADAASMCHTTWNAQKRTCQCSFHWVPANS